MAILDLLDECYETASLYRQVTSSSGSWDSVTSSTAWVKVQDISIYIEPTTPADTELNDQNYQGGVYRGTLPIDYDGVLKENDGIIDSSGVSYIVTGSPQPFRHILPHIYCVLKTRQFQVSV
jgi:hypothetical protein